MLTLDEAIKHCEEKAKELREQPLKESMDIEDIADCEECAEEHEQLAKWLTELKELRKFTNKLYCPNKRPKAEWKETGYETGALGITYRQTQCSNCGWEHALPMWWNFCPNCGAQMRKGGAE